MSRKPRPESAADLYHVISRGTGKQIIFESDKDRRTYLAIVKKRLVDAGFALIAWCLMDNHVHLLVQGALDKISFSMMLLNSDYAKYFNRTHGRTGHLFEARFKSEPVEDETYLLTVLRYIHQNPVKAGITATCKYPWSSFGEYASGQKGLCDRQLVCSMFPNSGAFLRFHEEVPRELDIELFEQPELMKDDDRTVEFVRDLLGGIELGEIKALPLEERNEALCKLRARGISFRRIERLTGIGRSVVARVVNFYANSTAGTGGVPIDPGTGGAPSDPGTGGAPGVPSDPDAVGVPPDPGTGGVPIDPGTGGLLVAL